MAILWEGSHTLPYYGFKLSKEGIEHIPQIRLIEKTTIFVIVPSSLVVVSLWQKLIQDIEWNGTAQLSYFLDKFTYPPFKMSKSKFIFFLHKLFNRKSFLKQTVGEKLRDI